MDLTGLPFFTGIAIYCYEGAGMILSLEASIAKDYRSRFKACVFINQPPDIIKRGLAILSLVGIRLITYIFIVFQIKYLFITLTEFYEENQNIVRTIESLAVAC